jgi:hypothetical protein
MRKFEVITKQTNTAKLTIAKDRVTVKLPTSITLVDADRIVNFFKKVADQHPSPQTTLRGNNGIEKVFKYGIELYAGVRTNRNGVLVSTHKFEV